MKKLTREDLLSLEKYSEVRNDFRSKVIKHKKNRRLPIGPNATLYFEDNLIMHYQIQEMLRAERIFEANAINDELAVYNELIPDGNNWKATFMIEFADEGERRLALSKMFGIEDKVWLKIDGFNEIYPFSDEDLERENENKTSAVHFLRFQLNHEMVGALKLGSQLSAGISHGAYQHTVNPIPDNIRESLISDLD
ncbi:MAG: hypothetical protein CMF53_00970 [Legionellales bacterium]|mgnify:FL=1|jgi:hypothetical protein|nr:hypothetical protein [Legionellales bacterium]HBH11032.1 DUF3501 domain-containing protein [Gammaproteobacteria bacterium]|tara:strand:+ start:484 stop:1068 length:585 start_codon:yes stop_codon:yes gene_type:complete